ncbi:MAG: YncE family protein [Solitalea-like symbiont of Tyrophagus putrescentiae]
MKKKLNKFCIAYCFSIIAILLAFSCVKDDKNSVDIDIKDKGLLILSEGVMGKANSSLSFYTPTDKKIINNIFYDANKVPIGDVAQSIYESDSSLFIMVTNSRKILEIDKNNFKQKKSITENGIMEPRYMISANNKFYVSNYKANNILVFNKDMTLLKTISTKINDKAHAPNFILETNNKLFVACDFNDNTVLVINTQSDQQEGLIEVGITPASMVIDKNSSLWVLCTGGYEGHPLGQETPSLYKINTKNYSIESKIDMPTDVKWISGLRINSSLDTLYFLSTSNSKVMQMPITSTNASNITTLLTVNGTKTLYGLYVDTNDIYLTDAKDYQSNGALLRYSKNGNLLDSLTIGINPSFMNKINTAKK